MQGAFAEHQVMLQKLRVARPIVIVLVRQAEDLAKCDALIIPGGGTSMGKYANDHLSVVLTAFFAQNPQRSHYWRGSLV